MKSIRLCAAASVMAVCAIAILAAQSAQAQTYKVLYSFKGQPDGANPVAGVTRDAHGNLFGTTGLGGSPGVGTVFKLSTTGKDAVLYSFQGEPDGGVPLAGLIEDAKGNFYGTTEAGGAHGVGTVFKLSATGKETVLYSFGATGTDGGVPNAGLIRDAKGNLYGTTTEGGVYGGGTVFKLSSAKKETVLYSFCAQSNCADGDVPYAGVIQDTQGNLYGTTFRGGYYNTDGCIYGCGTVFKLSPTGKETVLHAFTGSTTGGPDGGFPFGGVVEDGKGNLYGTTWSGGLSGVGTVFKLSKLGKVTVLYNFCAQSGCPAAPRAGVIRDGKGNLYGTTEVGGVYNAGAVFRLSTTGKETTLHSFTGNDGALPFAGVVQDAEGNLYGTTETGGDLSCNPPAGCGVAFKLTP